MILARASPTAVLNEAGPEGFQRAIGKPFGRARRREIPSGNGFGLWPTMGLCGRPLDPFAPICYLFVVGEGSRRKLLFRHSTQNLCPTKWAPKVSKGRSESPLVAPAGAKPLRGNVSAFGRPGGFAVAPWTPSLPTGTCLALGKAAEEKLLTPRRPAPAAGARASAGSACGSAPWRRGRRAPRGARPGSPRPAAPRACSRSTP